jgi:hypothetical protein
MAKYSIACEENGDLIAYKHKKGGEREAVFVGKEYLWHYLRYVNDHGSYEKIQDFSLQVGMNEAYTLVRSELGLTKEQEEILDELVGVGTKLIKHYEVDYSDFL